MTKGMYSLASKSISWRKVAQLPVALLFYMAMAPRHHGEFKDE